MYKGIILLFASTSEGANRSIIGPVKEPAIQAVTLTMYSQGARSEATKIVTLNSIA